MMNLWCRWLKGGCYWDRLKLGLEEEEVGLVGVALQGSTLDESWGEWSEEKIIIRLGHYPNDDTALFFSQERRSENVFPISGSRIQLKIRCG